MGTKEDYDTEKRERDERIERSKKMEAAGEDVLLGLAAIIRGEAKIRIDATPQGYNVTFVRGK